MNRLPFLPEHCSIKILKKQQNKPYLQKNVIRLAILHYNLKRFAIIAKEQRFVNCFFRVFQFFYLFLRLFSENTAPDDLLRFL